MTEMKSYFNVKTLKQLREQMNVVEVSYSKTTENARLYANGNFLGEANKEHIEGMAEELVSFLYSKKASCSRNLTSY